MKQTGKCFCGCNARQHDSGVCAICGCTEFEKIPSDLLPMPKKPRVKPQFDLVDTNEL